LFLPFTKKKKEEASWRTQLKNTKDKKKNHVIKKKINKWFLLHAKLTFKRIESNLDSRVESRIIEK
jgi:hypothetical protein